MQWRGKVLIKYILQSPFNLKKHCHECNGVIAQPLLAPRWFLNYRWGSSSFSSLSVTLRIFLRYSNIHTPRCQICSSPKLAGGGSIRLWKYRQIRSSLTLKSLCAQNSEEGLKRLQTRHTSERLQRSTENVVLHEKRTKIHNFEWQLLQQRKRTSLSVRQLQNYKWTPLWFIGFHYSDTWL